MPAPGLLKELFNYLIIREAPDAMKKGALREEIFWRADNDHRLPQP
jgi:hypothetical protein